MSSSTTGFWRRLYLALDRAAASGPSPETARLARLEAELASLRAALAAARPA